MLPTISLLSLNLFVFDTSLGGDSLESSQFLNVFYLFHPRTNWLLTNGIMKMTHRLFLFTPKKKEKKNENDPQENSKEFMQMFIKFSKNFRLLLS